MASPALRVPGLVTVELPHPAGVAIPCPFCDKIYRQPGCFRKHVEREHPAARFHFRCRTCHIGLTDSTKRAIDTHLRVCPGIEPAVDALIAGARRLFPSPEQQRPPDSPDA